MIARSPSVRAGQPCISGTRVSVGDVLRYTAGGMTADDIAADFPGVEPEDVADALRYAAEHLERAGRVEQDVATSAIEHAGLNVALVWHALTRGRASEAMKRLHAQWPDFASALARLTQICEAQRPVAFEETFRRFKPPALEEDDEDVEAPTPRRGRRL